MRRSETLKIKHIINALLKEQGLEGKMSENRLLNSWEDLLGKSVAKATRELYIKDQVLFVQLRSSIVRNELLMIKTDLIKRLNEVAGRDVIKDIVLR
jgi:predicted nucleic acid-binding Zn ribbon protein